MSSPPSDHRPARDAASTAARRRRRSLPVPWIQGDTPVARMVAQPVHRFLEVEAAGGIVLVAATVVAVALASSPWQAGYHRVFETVISIDVGRHSFAHPVVDWINDALMAIFFFVVGLEIKREWVAGELRDRRAAALPAVAALGGMVVPAAIYAVVNHGGPGAGGWGIPMATDIAFALGVTALLGSRVPAPLKVFLLTLAIVDDIGAILVIAIFYSGGIAWGWFAAAALTALAVAGLWRVKVRRPVVFVVLAVVLWFCTYESGVHATIAGVVMAFLTPATPFLGDAAADEVVDELEGRDELSAADVRRVGFLLRESVPVSDRLEVALHPWTTFLIVPLFALANAGIDLGGPGFSSPTAVSVGVVVALVVGKALGITLGSVAAVRSGLGRLPDGVGWLHVLGVGLLGGIGFTVSLFVAGLAFADGPLLEEAKAGILVASVLAAVVGASVLALAARRRDAAP